MDELIVYSNSRHGLGIRILGSRRMTGQQGIYVKELLPGGLAERDGRLKVKGLIKIIQATTLFLSFSSAKVGDQIISINHQSVIDTDRAEALRILRSAALSNEVHLRVRHIYSTRSSINDRNFLSDHFSSPHSHSRSIEQFHDRSSYASSFNGERRKDERLDRLAKQFNVSSIALRSLLCSNYQLMDLIDLLKKNSSTCPLHDPIQEFHFIHQLTQNHPGDPTVVVILRIFFGIFVSIDGRITMEDFEYEYNSIYGEDRDILKEFYLSLGKNLVRSDNDRSVQDLEEEIHRYRLKIVQLESEILLGEKSQSLAKQIENEYEYLMHNLLDQIQNYHFNQDIYVREANMKEKFLNRLLSYVPDYYHRSV